MTELKLSSVTARLAALALLLALSASLNAGTIQVQLVGFNPSPYSTFGRSVIDPSNNQRVTSDTMDGGRFQLSLLSGDPNEFVGGTTLFAFCIEPREYVSFGSNYTYSVDPLENGATNIGGMGVAKANLLRELFGRYYPDFTAPLTRQQAGALQIAAWEIVRENSGTLDVYSGDIYFYPGPGEDPAGTVALAQTYVKSLNGQGPMLDNLVALDNFGAQDLVTELMTPEPASFALFGGGFALFALLRRKTVRR